MKPLLSLLLVLSILSVQAQDEKKALKSYYKSDYEEAEIELDKINKLYRFSPLGHYGMALLYSNPRFAKADLFKAFDWIKVAVEKKKHIRPSQLEELEKYFTLDSIELISTRINQMLFDSVMAKDSWAYTRQYVERCKGAPHYPDVLMLAVHQQFRAVKDTNTVASYNWFIKAFPTEKQIEEATRLRDALAWEACQKTNTLDAYQSFLDAYPAAQQAPQAEARRDELAFEQARSQNTIEAYTQFVADYPQAKQAPEAQEATQTLAFQQAKAAANDEAWADFLRLYPDSKLAPQANLLRQQQALARATATNTEQAYNQFLEQFPKSSLYAQAFDQKVQLVSNNFQSQLQQGASPSQVLVLQRFAGNEKSVRHIKTSKGYLLLGGLSQRNKWQNDAWVLHLDTQGKLIWERQLGGPFDDLLTHALPNAQGFLLAGYTKGKSSTDRQVWIVQLDHQGQTLWERTAEGIEVQGLAAEADGALVATTWLDTDRMHQLMLLRIDTQGELQAHQKYPNLGAARAVVRTEAGERFVLTQNKLYTFDDQLQLLQTTALPKGVSAYQLRMLPTGLFALGRVYDVNKTSLSDLWLAQISPTGQLAWEKSYDNNQQQDIAYDLAATADGNLVLAGLTEAAGTDHLVLLRLSADGTQQATQLLGTSASDRRPSLVIDTHISLLFSSGLESDLLFVFL